MIINPDIFFLPLGSGSKWGNNELRYMLRSLEKYWQDDFEVIIYGDPDCKPDWLQNVTYKEVPRFYPEGLAKKYKGSKRFEQFFCVLNKVREFVYSNHYTEKFIYIYDDVLLLQPQNVIYNYPLTTLKKRDRKDRHVKTKNVAFDLLPYQGFIFDYETHLPREYTKSGLRMLFEHYDFRSMDMPYPLATMYFNTIENPGLQPLDKGHPRYKVGFYFSDQHPCDVEATTVARIELGVKDKTWMSYNDLGLNCGSKDTDGDSALKQWIRNNFNKPSKYEKDS